MRCLLPPELRALTQLQFRTFSQVWRKRLICGTKSTMISVLGCRCLSFKPGYPTSLPIFSRILTSESADRQPTHMPALQQRPVEPVHAMARGEGERTQGWVVSPFYESKLIQEKRRMRFMGITLLLSPRGRSMGSQRCSPSCAL